MVDSSNAKDVQSWTWSMYVDQERTCVTATISPINIPRTPRTDISSTSARCRYRERVLKTSDVSQDRNDSSLRRTEERQIWIAGH